MRISRIRFYLALIMAVCIAITSFVIPVSATENLEILDSLPDFGEDYIPLSAINYTIDEKIVNQSLMDITEIIVSKENIEIKATLYSEFIDVFGKLENGKYINITDEVVCEFEDKSIATWIFGRIIAEEQGTTTAMLKYNGKSKKINITVNETFIPESNVSIRNALAAGEIGELDAVKDPHLDERLNILETARAMVEVQWTPTQTFNAYGTHDPFIANTPYIGMPYSQNSQQSTLSEFINALYNSSASGFYNYFEDDETPMPKYGNDCSGFVSICWGFSGSLLYDRTRWNTSDFEYSIELGICKRVDYANLKMGDALLNDHHIMLVRFIIPSSGDICVYEQTGLTAHTSLYSSAFLQDCHYIGLSKFYDNPNTGWS